MLKHTIQFFFLIKYHHVTNVECAFNRKLTSDDERTICYGDFFFPDLIEFCFVLKINFENNNLFPFQSR